MRPAPDDPEVVGRPMAVEDLPLFAPPPVNPRREAERQIAPERNRLQAAVLEALRTYGPMTADEIAVKVGETALAIRPRVTELGNAGLLVDTGDRRTNVSGRPATVWGRR